MYSESIDVAEIMRKLKAEIVPEETENITFNGAAPQILVDTFNEVNRIHSFLINTRNNIEDHKNIGNKIPDFNRFNWFLKKTFRVITRILAKATRFITREQLIVNTDVSNSLKAVVESEQQIMKAFSCMQELIDRNGQLEMKYAEMSNKYYDISNKYVEVSNNYNELRNINSKLIKDHAELQKIIKDVSGLNIDNQVYLKFEDAFRGTADEIKRRLNYYIDNYIITSVNKESIGDIIDIGCGRGEWLELLRNNGYDPVGIDTNKAMVQFCTNKGLNVICSDAVTYLESLSDNSVKLLTAFQVIEHMQFNQLNDFLKEIVRVLDKDGLIILETPNPHNFEVGSCNFYNDPTHKRPVHPSLLEFLVKEYGISKTQIAYWKEEECNNWWNSLLQSEETEIFKSSAFRTVSETIKNSMYNSPDYALIAVK